MRWSNKVLGIGQAHCTCWEQHNNDAFWIPMSVSAFLRFYDIKFVNNLPFQAQGAKHYLLPSSLITIMIFPRVTSMARSYPLFCGFPCHCFTAQQAEVCLIDLSYSPQFTLPFQTSGIFLLDSVTSLGPVSLSLAASTSLPYLVPEQPFQMVAVILIVSTMGLEKCFRQILLQSFVSSLKNAAVACDAFGILSHVLN